MTVKANLNFAKTTSRGPDGFFRVKAEFHEDDIHVDASLGFPWRVGRQIGVLPHRRMLCVEERPGALNLLSSVETPSGSTRQVKGA